MNCSQFTIYSPPSCSVSCVVYHIWRMKTFINTLSLFLMLCCVLQLTTSTDTVSGDMANSNCCFYESSQIPLRQLESYFWTSTICPLKYTVFVTIKKKQICGNPKTAWVKRAMKYIDDKRASNSAK